MKYCVKCGAELNDDAFLCPKCGCLTNDYSQNIQRELAKYDVDKRPINKGGNEKTSKIENLFQIFSMISITTFSMVFLFFHGYFYGRAYMVLIFGIFSFISGLLTFIFGLITKKRNIVLKAISYFVISCAILYVTISNFIYWWW